MPEIVGNEIRPTHMDAGSAGDRRERDPVDPPAEFDPRHLWVGIYPDKGLCHTVLLSE